jgi:biopolymer transport protein ExbD
MRRLAKGKPQREPTIALINIVFLMLVFFMVAGTLAQPLDPKLTLVHTPDLESRAPPDALVVHADGRLSFRGADMPDAAAYMTGLDVEGRATVRLVPDRAFDAQALVTLSRALQAAGAARVMIVTERGVR